MMDKPKEFEIIVNGRPQKVANDVVTFDQIVGLAPNLPPPGPEVEYTITYKNAAHSKSGSLIQGETLEIKNGTEFVVTATNRS